MRRPKTNHVPRTRAGGEWTEAAFWSWLRSGLRMMSRRWPPIVRIALHNARKPYKGPNKRQKWVYQCAMCNQWYKATEVHVDHIIPCGSLKAPEEIHRFVMRLFCEPDRLRVLCEECHKERH